MIQNLVILFTIGALFAMFEIIADKYDESIFPKGKLKIFFDPILSWKLKYKTGFKPIPIGLYGYYHKFFNLKYKEKFPLSGTLLVFLTDFRHILKLSLVISIVALALFYVPFMGVWVDWLLGVFILLGIFELFYSKILIITK